MWSTIISLVLKFIDTDYFKILWIASLCFCVGSLTYLYQAHKYEAQINDIKAQLAIQVAEQEKEYASKLSKATSDLVLSNRRADSARAERDILSRRLLDANNREDKRAAENPNGSYREEYASCRKLLSEGIDLLNEGADLVGRIAAEKDALAASVK